MNDTSATSQPGASLLPDGIGALTAVHLLFIALLAIAAIAIIVIGMRRARVRRQATEQVERHAEEAGVPTPAEQSATLKPDDGPNATALPAEPAAPAPSVDRSEPAAANEPKPEPAPLADEPIAAAAPMEASPASEASAEPAPPAPSSPADGPVTQLKGLGPKVAAALGERGITTVGQLAALDDADAAALDAELGSFRGRMARDRWIEQARFLAAGDRAGFEAVFGKL